MIARGHKAGGNQADEGYVLVFVLIAVALIATLATFMVRAGHQAAKQAQLEQQLVAARFGADGAVHALIADLLDGRLVAPAQGDLMASLLPGGYSGTYRVRPVSGLLDLNRAPDALLSAAFEAAGASDPESLTAAVADWRDRDSEVRTKGAENDHYEAVRQPGPSNRPFVSVRELLYVRGVDRALFARLEDALTVWGASRIDEDVAHPLVIVALDSMSRAERRRVTASASASFSSATQIEVTVTAAGGLSYTRNAVVRILPGQTTPFLMLDWRRRSTREISP